MVTVFARSEVTNIADTAPAGAAGRFCFIRSSLQQKEPSKAGAWHGITGQARGAPRHRPRLTRPSASPLRIVADSEGRPRTRPPVVLFNLLRDYPRFPSYYPRLHRSLYINRLTHLYVILVF